MILGAPNRSMFDPPSGVLVHTDQVASARKLLEDIAKQTKGSSLTPWQKQQLRKMAPVVAARMTAGIHPVLTDAQAMQLYKIAAQ